MYLLDISVEVRLITSYAGRFLSARTASRMGIDTDGDPPASRRLAVDLSVRNSFDEDSAMLLGCV
jgi:hypothetical protein